MGSLSYDGCMHFLSRFSSLAYLLIAAAFVLAKPSHAYLDPGTGSYMLQMLLAGLFGAVFAVKTFWTQIKAGLYKVTRKTTTQS